MRIRKRKVPLPLSLLSPVPLSDPNLFTRSPVALHLHHHQHQPQPSDHFPPASSPPSDLITPGTHSAAEQQGYKHKEQDEHEGEEKSCLEFQGGGGGGERVLPQQRSIHHNDDVDDDTSKQQQPKAGAIPAAVNNNEGGGGGRWSEGERVMPLKKRRPSSEPAVAVMADDGPNNNVQNITKKSGGGGNGSNNGKQKRGTTIMEGSRCSRVNGRGWRCCQPTLVGYSLCEHHLGKGRLRSMTTVRGRPAAPKKPPKVKDNDNNNNKRVNYKLGVVKARSLSSLLGQTTTTETARTTTADDHSSLGCVDQ